MAVIVPVSLTDVPASSTLPEVRVLLDRFCVSVVPTIAPPGAVTVVKAEVPLPITTPLKVVAPVPPLPTGSVPLTFAVRLQYAVAVEPVPPLAIGNVPVTLDIRLQ